MLRTSVPMCCVEDLGTSVASATLNVAGDGVKMWVDVSRDGGGMWDVN